MFTTIRKHQRWLMLIIAVLTIIAFAFLYNTTDPSRVGSNMVAKIYGRDVMQVDIERAVRNYQLAMALGQFSLIRELAGQAQSEDEAVNNFIWNLMVLQHESAALGVEPGQQAVVDRIKSLPVFQTDGQFDPLKYSTFMQEQLAPRGFTERQLESVIRDVLRLEGVHQLVVSPAVVMDSEIDPALQRLAPTDVEIVRFSTAELAKDVSVPDDELQKAFEEQKENLKSPEKRSVRYVAFVLDPEQMELKDKERVQALQTISTATGNLAQTLGDGETSLAEAAAASGLEVRTTPLFSRDGSTGGALEGIDGEVVPAAANVAFRLPASPGAFEIVQVGDEGYAIIEVENVEPARPLTFEEARADLLADLIDQKSRLILQETADKALASIREALASGKTIAEAAGEAGVTSEAKKGLTLFSEDLTPEERQLAMAVVDLPVGTLGGFVPNRVAVRRLRRSEASLMRKCWLSAVRSSCRRGQGKQMLLFAQWLSTARDGAGLQILRPMM